MLTTLNEILGKAKREGYGVAAPDAYSSSSVMACFKAAENLKAPLIVSCLGTTNMEETGENVKFYARKYPDAVVTLHLDHGGSFEEIMRALRSGYTSVMIDRSKLPFEENVREVREVVRIAHAMGVSVEAELGHVGNGFEYEETRDSGLTNKEQALSYIEETGIDCLAVAVGTSHGAYKGTPHLEFDLLAELHRSIALPLVLHGGSGTGDDNLKHAVETGIQKVNLFTDLSAGGMVTLKEYLGVDYDSMKKDSSLGEFGNPNANLYDAIVEGTAGWKATLAHYVELFGGANRI